jgi:hypothetical protein
MTTSTRRLCVTLVAVAFTAIALGALLVRPNTDPKAARRTTFELDEPTPPVVVPAPPRPPARKAVSAERATTN